MKQIVVLILSLIIGFAAADAQRYRYVADSPVADVIFCSETPDEHGMINRKNSGEWTIKCGDTVTVVGRKVVTFYLDSINATNIYAIIDDNGHRLYTEARFLTPVDPEQDFFAADKFKLFNPSFLYDYFGDSWDMRSGKGRSLYSLLWPIAVFALMLLSTVLLCISFLSGFNKLITFCAALAALASIALLSFLIYHLGIDIIWWANAMYCSTLQSLCCMLLVIVFMLMAWYNFILLYVASDAPVWPSILALILFWPIITGVSLLLFDYQPDADAATHAHRTLAIGTAICFGLPCLYGLIRRGWLGMVMPLVYIAALYTIFFMFYVMSFIYIVATGAIGLLILYGIFGNGKGSHRETDVKWINGKFTLVDRWVPNK